MSASKIFLVSGDKGLAIFDKEFRCICTVQLDSESVPEIYFVDRQLDQFTFVFGNKDSKELFKTTHSVPKEFKLTEDERAGD